MAVTNQERVSKAMEFLKEGLQPFVEREGPGFGSAADAPQRRAAAGAAGRGRGEGQAAAALPPSGTQFLGATCWTCGTA